MDIHLWDYMLWSSRIGSLPCQPANAGRIVIPLADLPVGALFAARLGAAAPQ
jgi:hypothetical protein